MRATGIEHDFLSVVRATVGALPARAVVSSLVRQASVEDQRALEAGLRSEVLGVLQETLARGCALQLLRRGGWRSGTFFGERGAVRRGRLWERSPPPLSFGRGTYELCCLLTVQALTVQALRPAMISTPPADAPAPLPMLDSGDELFVYLACDMLAGLGLSLAPLRPWLARATLAPLAFPEVTDGLPAAPLAQPFLLEALQPDLARQLLRLEAYKRTLRSPRALADIGRLQERSLGHFVAAAEQAGRIDLLAFVAEASRTVVGMDGSFFRLDRAATLGARQAARDAAAGVVRIAARVAELHTRARLVGFVDDGYEQAQALLHAWEPYEPALARATGAQQAWTGLLR